MNSSKKFFAVLCAFSFISCAFAFAQEADGSLSNQQETEQTQVLNQNKINESQYTLGNSGDTDSGDTPVKSSPLSTVWVFFKMILVLGIVLAIIWIIFKLMKKSSDTDKSNDEFLRKVSSITISP